MTLNDYRDQCHAANQKWWQDVHTDRIIITAKSSSKEETVTFDAKHLETSRIDVFQTALSRLVQDFFGLSKDERPSFKISVPHGYRLALIKEDA